jgi:putative protease
MKKLELLAPAKDMECGIAAITCGADAVYIGAERFSARDKAYNSLGDIETLVKYAHKYWARIYVALNTLLKDEELPEAVELIERLYAIGVDALIIQDYGLLEEKLPPIPLFASTQLNNRTPEKIMFLEKAGFQRVILARELDLEQIRNIRAKTTVDLECFVHGALCVAYSGQCYLSYALGGRSGNRGNCAQPCRKKYSLYDEAGNLLAKDQYLLSLKDLNLSAHLKELAEAGITSFKIEGRLKDVSYIKNIVSFYRQELDKIIDNKKYSTAASGSSKVTFIPDPAKTFNRGFTEYFLQGRNKDLKSLNTPKSIGEYLGKVAAVEGRRFKLDR